MAKEYRTFWGNENVLKLFCGNIYTIYEYNKSQLWIFNELTVWYVNYISIKLLKIQEAKSNIERK